MNLAISRGASDIVRCLFEEGITINIAMHTRETLLLAPQETPPDTEFMSTLANYIACIDVLYALPSG